MSAHVAQSWACKLDCGGEGVPRRVRERLITGPQASLSLLSISR